MPTFNEFGLLCRLVNRQASQLWLVEKFARPAALRPLLFPPISLRVSEFVSAWLPPLPSPTATSFGSWMYYALRPIYRFATSLLPTFLTSVWKNRLPIVVVSFWLSFGVYHAINRRYGTHQRIRVCVSRFLDFFNQAVERPETLRSAFSRLVLFTPKLVEGHTHASAAACRSAACSFMDFFAAYTGYNAFVYQRSRADERKNRNGMRSYYWTKDTAASPSIHQLPEHPLITMTDVDYYVDMPQYLASNFKPTLLYTFQPDDAADDAGDYAYTFNHEGQVEYDVRGGGRYKHHVWNYSADQILVHSTFLGFSYATAAFNVDRRKCSKDHYLVLLTPLCKWYLPSIFVSWFVSGTELRRIDPVRGDYARLQLNTPSGMEVSTAVLGQYAHVTVPASVDDTVSNLVRVSKHDITIPSVDSAMGPPELDPTLLAERRAAATILVAYHRSKLGHPRPDLVVPVAEGTHTYQFGHYEPEAKPSLTPFMSPILDECYVPDRTKGNEERAVQTRIKDHKSDVEITPFIESVMREFCELFIPIPHQGVPQTIDEVIEKQDRPSQRRILEDAQFSWPQRIIKFFTKSEAAAKPADPRVISTINGADKRDYSTFIYAISEHIKSAVWYAFGLSPRSISERVADICKPAAKFVLTDFTRLDGTISPAARVFERMVLLRYFATPYHPILIELHGAVMNLKAIGTFGTKYNSGTSRLSGEPATSFFNTLINAFVAFFTLRRTKVNGAFLTPHEAWTRLGLYGGDDGGTANICAKLYAESAALLGLKLKAETIERGRFGVTFLARVYSADVWTGSPDSCCDLPRQLSKFHATVTLPDNITPEQKLIEKARSFYDSDKNTPILGSFVTRVCELSAGVEITATQAARWGSDVSAEVQYPNGMGDWMLAYATAALDGFDVDRFEAWLASCKTVTELLSPPLCLERKPVPLPVVPVIVDHVQHNPTVPPEPKLVKYGPITEAQHVKLIAKRVPKPNQPTRKPFAPGSEPVCARNSEEEESTPRVLTTTVTAVLPPVIALVPKTKVVQSTDKLVKPAAIKRAPKSKTTKGPASSKLE